MRGSILTRPLKASSRINDETVDDQFRREQAMLELKRQKYIDREENLRSHIQGSRSIAEKLALLEVNRETFENHVSVAREHTSAERRREAAALEELHRREAEAASREHQKKISKMIEAKKIMEENLALNELRKKMAKEQLEHERELERANIQIQLSRFQNRTFR